MGAASNRFLSEQSWPGGPISHVLVAVTSIWANFVFCLGIVPCFPLSVDIRGAGLLACRVCMSFARRGYDIPACNGFDLMHSFNLELLE